MKTHLLLLFFSLVAIETFAQINHKTENVVLITLDGFRWQEVFSGADSSLMHQQKNLKDDKLTAKYWRNNVDERRKALLPFFWTTIASKGQLYGNRSLGSKVNVTNNQWFSYPGYNEILTGKADNDRIHSNDKIYNPNTNVLEFINSQKSFSGKVAAFTSWDVFPYIINEKRNGILVSSGQVPVTDSKGSEMEKALNVIMKSIPNPLGDVRLDAFTFYYGLEYMKKNKPRVMYFAFDETDDFAHGGEYGAYLNSAHYTDRFIGELWNYLQSEAMYRDKTTFIITCDHGRGNNSDDWKHHGTNIANSDQIWIAVIGPDTKANGEIKSDTQFYQNQVAKTMATLLDLDYKGEGEIGSAILPIVKDK